MDSTDILLAKIDLLNGVILMLGATILLLVGFILQTPLEDDAPRRHFGRKAVDPICPLHRIPRSTCSAESHEDTE